MNTRRHVHDYGAGYLLAALFLASWVLQTWFGWVEYRDEGALHGQAPTLVGYMPLWARATFENWQSEFLQVLAAALIFRKLLLKGSPESKEQ